MPVGVSSRPSDGYAPHHCEERARPGFERLKLGRHRVERCVVRPAPRDAGPAKLRHAQATVRQDELRQRRRRAAAGPPTASIAAAESGVEECLSLLVPEMKARSEVLPDPNKQRRKLFEE